MTGLKRKVAWMLSPQGTTKFSNEPEKRQRLSPGRKEQSHQNIYKTGERKNDELFANESPDYGLKGVRPAQAVPLPEDDINFGDDLTEDGMVHLPGSTSVFELEEPPSSILRNRDRSSRSAEEYDPALQHSPVPTYARSAIAAPDQQISETEVDWEHVRNRSHRLSGSATEANCGSIPLASSSPCTLRAAERDTETKIPPDFKLKPFKTFLHIRDLVNTKTQMFKNSKSVSFELFSRVIYSSRENFTRKQYFQFRDLLAETPPYLSGILKDWISCPSGNSVLTDFLRKQSVGMKCYCQCSLIPDSRSELGWSAIIEDIRPISWKEIRLIVDTLGLTDLDHPHAARPG